jgi:hypothetical protein
MPTDAEVGVVLLCDGDALPLRRVSPRSGSSESGRGVVVLLVEERALFFSREMAVIQERSNRIACKSDESLSLASWLISISSASVLFNRSSLAVIRSLT